MFSFLSFWENRFWWGATMCLFFLGFWLKIWDRFLGFRQLLQGPRTKREERLVPENTESEIKSKFDNKPQLEAKDQHISDKESIPISEAPSPISSSNDSTRPQSPRESSETNAVTVSSPTSTTSGVDQLDDMGQVKSKISTRRRRKAQVACAEEQLPIPQIIIRKPSLPDSLFKVGAEEEVPKDVDPVLTALHELEGRGVQTQTRELPIRSKVKPVEKVEIVESVEDIKEEAEEEQEQESESRPSSRRGSTSSSVSNAASESSSLEYEQQSFETYQSKVIQLCEEIGLGKPTEVERMSGGSSNRIIGVTFANDTQYVVRIPRWALGEDEAPDIKDQVAVLLYLSAHLPVAKIAAYDSTTENALACQYVIQERMPGVPVDTAYKTMTIDEKLELATIIAELLHKIESIKLPSFGRLPRTPDILAVCHDVSQLPTSDIAITGYRLEGTDEMPTTDAQSLLALLNTMIETRSELDGDEDPVVEGFWKRLQQMVTEMVAMGFLSDAKESARLGHWDLSTANVLIAKIDHAWAVTGVLDWDDAMSAAAVIGRKPPIWLWDPEVRVEDADTTEPGVLNNDQKLIKKRFDGVASEKSLTFVDDAYQRGKWLRRLMAFALHGFSYSQDWERCRVLIKDWESFLEVKEAGKKVKTVN